MTRTLQVESEDEDILLRLTRRVVNYQRRWRICKRPLCRRRHACTGNPQNCAIDGEPTPELSPQQRSQVSHDIRKALDKRRVELQVEEQARERMQLAGGVQRTWTSRGSARSDHATGRRGSPRCD
jgi:hypothetical protein